MGVLDDEHLAAVAARERVHLAGRHHLLVTAQVVFVMGCCR